MSQVLLLLGKLEFEYRAFRRGQVDLLRLLDPPRGTARRLGNYVPLSQHAPNAYGINRFGIPASEAPEVHARARQLKGFLYPFEQLMANCLASTQAVRHLYSLNPRLHKSYFSQFLGERAVPGLRQLYADGKGGSAASVARTLADYDSFGTRRNRVLDSLLAMYGETFPAEALQQLDAYQSALPREAALRHLVNCKIAYLRCLPELSAGRAGGFDITRRYWDGNNYATLQHRLLLLLGCGVASLGRSLTAHLSSQTLRFVSGQHYREHLPLIDTSKAQALPLSYFHDAQLDAPPITRLPQGLLCTEVLRAGIDLRQYRVLEIDKQQVLLCLATGGDPLPWPLVRLPQPKVAEYAERLRACLMLLNRKTEGLHLVEHVLLRPRATASVRRLAAQFYSQPNQRVLPAFSARFSDPTSRHGLKNWWHSTCQPNFPRIYWLGFIHLADFELRYSAG